MSKRLAPTLFAVAAALSLTGCASSPDEGELKTTANIANDSPAAKSAGAAPLINPNVPPPGGPMKKGK